MTTVRPLFPPAIDSTMTGAFRSCPRKMELAYVNHWKPNTESVHLVAGGAFAAGIEHARKAFFELGASREDAALAGYAELTRRYGDFECPPDSAKSYERTLGALEFYLDQYPLGGDGLTPYEFAGRKAIEFSFAIPLNILHPVTGEPLLYTGRADLIANYAGGVYAVDEKTTSSLGSSWARQWELRSQFTGYQYAARAQGIPVQGTIVRGISILKTKYDTIQHLTNRTQYELDRWWQQLHFDVLRMIDCWKRGYWDFNLDHACAEYGGCGFREICKSEHPDALLPMYFAKKVWDPVAKEEVSVEEWESKWRVE